MLDPQLKRGMLEVCVLSALCRGESYGYKLIKDLSQCVELSESTLYPILRRLQSAGCITENSVAYNGRLRKIYTLMPMGRAQIGEFLASWHELYAMYEFIMEGMRDGQE